MSGASTLWSVAAQMMIGLGIAHAVFRRVSAARRSETAPKAFLLAGALTLVSLIGYPGLANDAGRSLADKTGAEPTGTPTKAAN